MEIIDYSKKFKKNESTGKHSYLFPQNIFCIIAGHTGCGKTNLLVNMLMKENTLNYSDVYVYSSTLHQPAYEYLKDYYKRIEFLVQTECKKSVKIAHFYHADEDILNPSELATKTNHIMVFDDVMNEDQTVIKDYFCRGRHNNVNVFYLCQSLNKIAKHCIKDNANIFILFKQHEKTLKYFHECHISGDMLYKEFQQLCKLAWKEEHGFVVINLWDKIDAGRYWVNYKNIYVPKTN